MRFFLFFVFAAALSASFFFYKEASKNDILGTMKIESEAFGHGGQIPPPYTCDGENVSPSLAFSAVPEGTKTLALVVDDPDAPNGLWVHWLLWNIPPNTKTIGEGGAPKGAVEGTTSFGATQYGGPCPPDGEHRYFFKLYALDSEIELPTSATKEGLEEAMIGHILERAETVGLYSKI